MKRNRNPQRRAQRIAARRAARQDVVQHAPGLSLDVSDLGEGVALVAIDHDLLGPLVREAARGLSDYLRGPTAMRCGGCGVRPPDEWLAVGPTNPPERALITRCANCVALPPTMDQRVGIVAMHQHLEAGTLSELRRGYVELLSQDAKARGDDAAWFAAHPARQYRARKPLTAQERQRAQPAGPWPVRLVVQRGAEPHHSAVAVPLPNSWIEAMHAKGLPAELLRDDRAEDALLGELLDLQHGQPVLMDPMTLMMRSLIRAKTLLMAAEATSRAGKGGAA